MVARAIARDRVLKTHPNRRCRVQRAIRGRQGSSGNDQVRRDQGQLRAVGIALVLMATTEQVLVDAENGLWRVVAHRVQAT